MFSLLMDIWTVLWADGTFNLARYAAAGRIGAAGNCGICGVKRDLPFDSGKPHRRKARENEEKIRTVCVGLAQARPTSFGDVMPGERIDGIKRGAFGPRFILQKNRKLRPEAVDKTEKRDKLQNRRRETFGKDLVGARNHRRIGL